MAGIQHGRKDKLMCADWKQCALFITFSLSLSITLTPYSLAFNHSPLCKCSRNFSCFDGVIVTKFFMGPLKLLKH